LLIPKDEVNPVMQIFWYILTLQGFTVLTHKFSCTTLGPRRQDNMIHLPCPKESHLNLFRNKEVQNPFSCPLQCTTAN
jgi:hypothetical protein